MGLKFTQIPSTTFKNLQMNAGILLDDFNPATGVIGNIIGATSGGINFTATPTYVDLGDGIDNCPRNMMELKEIQYIEATMSGNFVTVTAPSAKVIVGAADVDGSDTTHVVPRMNLETSDFDDIWWVGDYSDLNGETNGGFCAVHLMNALSTGGFQIQSTDKNKGQFAFTFTGHYSIDAQDTVPFEIYIKEGTAEPTTGGSTTTPTTGN